MPGSAHTVRTASTSVGSSSGSRRSKVKYNYYTVNRKSEVDESLFGKPARVLDKERRNNGAASAELAGNEEPRIERAAKARSAERAKKSHEVVRVITKDLIRNLIVPSEDPSGQSVVIPRWELERIKDAARALNEEELRAVEEVRKYEKEQKMNESEQRKTFMKEMDLNRSQNEKLSDLEQEAKEKAEVLLVRANNLRMENEDEIKHLNELILEAKCRAIRDAQILEKGQVRRELQEEAARLDDMMEIERQNQIAIQLEIEKRRKEEQMVGARKLVEQIQDIEQEKLLELEKKDQENLLMQKQIGKLMDEDRDRLEKKKMTQAELRSELNKANKEILERKENEREQGRLADLKVVEFQKQKAEREAAFEEEQERIKVEKEREVARLRALQEREIDRQAERDALRAQREQERLEREWRKKEADEARLQALVQEDLKQSRREQLEAKEHFRAVAAERERAEFERVLRAQVDIMEKEKHLAEEAVKRNTVYRDDIKKQMRQKERERIQERSKFFEEGNKLNDEARQRRAKLDEVKQRKLEELRSAGIHEKYLAQIERKVQLPSQINLK